ncbi:TRAP transporter small permease [Opitutales bacterium ASA1]|uniref:TRAP transporter small permease n=1 Tax=Congregicoccus parvus TaxID=3081749 RepID=UPI002B2A2AA1|nr:TRAP transporter small permease [Opitutales bacterium ASA1]
MSAPATLRSSPGWWLAIVRGLEGLTVALFGALTLVVLWGVFSRYVMGAQSTWTDELARYLLVWVSLVGASLMFREHGHLGVDYFVSKLHPDVQRVGAVFSELVVIAFALVALGIGGTKLVLDAFHANEMTSALGIRVGWLHLAAPLSGLFMAAFAVEHLLTRHLSFPAAKEDQS